jgi:hypothetical protein
MKILALVLGVFLLLLGALWTLQGLGVVTIPPILCVAACEPVQAPSMTWVAIGIGAIVAGMLATSLARRRY